MTIGATGIEPGSTDPVSEDAARRDRIRLLYQLPLQRATARVLIVGDGASALAPGWPGEAVVWPREGIAEALHEPEPSNFDSVAVPDLSSATDRHGLQLLVALASRLAPGGVLAGSARRSWADRHGMTARGPLRVKAVLEGAGFVDVECYLVQPSIDDPLALIPAAPAAAKAHFRRQLDCARPHFSALGYALRRLAIACGLGTRSQTRLFFWARRPC